ncbi:hypothetical protein F11_15530 [Rhodospirillum rubrum F11]|nr:hypothetical protein F11_15530 [Rhodospirillum rubrum F11]
MTGLMIVAYVVMPAVVVIGAYIAVRLHERAIHRR